MSESDIKGIVPETPPKADTVRAMVQIHCKCGVAFYVPRIGAPAACIACNRVYQVNISVIE